MIKYSMLKPEDVFDILDNIKFINKNKNSYVYPFLTEQEFTEKDIRINIFEYKEIYFGMYKNNKLKNIISYKVFSNPPYKNANLDLKLILDINNLEKNFFEFCKIEMTNNFPNISKIVCYVESKNNSKINSILNELGFQKEITLEDELESGDVDIYSNFIH